MEQLGQGIQAYIVAHIIPIGIFLIIAVLTIIALAFILPLQKYRDWAKEQILWVLLGAALLYKVIDVGTGIVQSFNF